MIYRRLGRAGLKGSALTLGTGALHNVGLDDAVAIFRRALDAGITHFDTAESYGGGETERRLGVVLRKLGVAREKFILSTKAFTYGWSDPNAAPHEVRTLNRKYLLHAIDRSLDKLQTEFVDIYYCHEMDPETPVEEIVETMSDIVRCGKARYWAVSNWSSDQLDVACCYAARRGLAPPILNQVEYNVLHRAAVASTIDAARAHGVGLAVWGPLAGGLLSGKYLTGTPDKSRGADAAMVAVGIADRLTDPKRNAIVAEVARIAAAAGCTVGQLAIAWTLGEPQVSTALIAASSLAQLEENLGALAALAALTADVRAQIADLVGEYDQSNIPEALPKS